MNYWKYRITWFMIYVLMTCFFNNYICFRTDYTLAKNPFNSYFSQVKNGLLTSIAVITIGTIAPLDVNANSLNINIDSTFKDVSYSLKNTILQSYDYKNTFLKVSVNNNHNHAIYDSSFLTSIKNSFQFDKQQSKGWELARQKRTKAIKQLQEQGIVTVDTDDSGNQFLSLPWIPNQKLPYKSLDIKQRLINEVSAGAFGEIVKDILLHSVDTLKTRKQAQKKNENMVENVTFNNTINTITSVSDIMYMNQSNMINFKSSSASLSSSLSSSIQQDNHINIPIILNNNPSNINISDQILKSILSFKALYAGFPIVALASIPQGGLFFLVKKGIIELFSVYIPNISEVISSTIPIIFGVAAYWLIRTPAEMLKTQVQTNQFSTVQEAINDAKINNDNGIWDLWKRYPVVLQLDIPFQMINFVLYGLVSDFVSSAGYSTGILTRLCCGVTCGMIAAAVTCPLDVGKTRIFSRQNTKLVVNNNTTTTNIYNSIDINLMNDNKTMKEDVILNNLQTTVNSNNDLSSNNIVLEIFSIAKNEGVSTLFLGLKQRLLYTGFANGIRLAAYGTSRMDLMMRSLDDL